jgi:Zn-dependent peptidase ImmA (M78 family)
MQCNIYRSSQDYQLSSVAATYPIQMQGTKASGFILIDRERAGSVDSKLDLAHEFFHVLQHAHNYVIGLGKTTDPVTGQQQSKPFWWEEASAE